MRQFDSSGLCDFESAGYLGASLALYGREQARTPRSNMGWLC